MDRNFLERYEKRVPRYTSYPTAPHFHPGITSATYQRWLSTAADAPMSLYLHVPFCHEMCWYCGCYTKIVRRYEPIGEYAAALIDEIRLIGGLIEARPQVLHMHWGGGTPTILSADDLERLMDEIRNKFDVTGKAEIAVEIDPRTMTKDRVRALARAGVNRASLGVQDFSEHVQKAMNRVQPFEMTGQVVNWLREAGILAINFDLMYGLPYQTVDDVRQSVDLAAGLRPDRVAMFGYAHVPWMKTHQKMIPDASLADPWGRFQQAEAGSARLVERGYRRIGLDHFALESDPMTKAMDEGRLHRNFQGYTTDRAQTLIGFGASSIGALQQGYVQNAAPLRAWAKAVRNGTTAVTKGIALSDEDRLRRSVIERLMCDMTVDLAGVAEQYGKGRGYFRDELERLEPMVADGLATRDGERIAITEFGRPLMRAVCALFDTYLDTGVARHSQAV